VVEPY